MDVTEQERRDAFVRASNRRVWRITAVAVAAILGLGFGAAAVVQVITTSNREAQHAREQRERDAALSRRQDADIACVKRWADDYTKRADRINTLAQPKSDALDRLVESIGDRAAFDHWRRVYLERSSRARANAQANPLPPSPVFACGLDPTPGPSHYVPAPSRPGKTPRPATTSPAAPTPGARPSTSPSSRNLATGHATAPVAATRTVHAGPTTRTVTVSPSSSAPRAPLPIIGTLACRPPLLPILCGS